MTDNSIIPFPPAQAKRAVYLDEREIELTRRVFRFVGEDIRGKLVNAKMANLSLHWNAPSNAVWFRCIDMDGRASWPLVQ